MQHELNIKLYNVELVLSVGFPLYYLYAKHVIYDCTIM